jgi:hypothetical protein
VARSAIRWTLDALTDDNRAWLAALPAGPVRWTTSSRSATARPSTRTPTSSTISTRCARCTPPSGPLCLFGHTHVQVGYSIVRNQFAVETSSDARPLDVAIDGASRAT